MHANLQWNHDRGGHDCVKNLRGIQTNVTVELLPGGPISRPGNHPTMVFGIVGMHSGYEGLYFHCWTTGVK